MVRIIVSKTIDVCSIQAAPAKFFEKINKKFFRFENLYYICNVIKNKTNKSSLNNF